MSTNKKRNTRIPLYWQPSNASSSIFHKINSTGALTLLIFMAVLSTYIFVHQRKQFGSNGKAYYYYSCDTLIQ